MVMGVEAAPRPRKTRRPASMMFSGVHHPFPSVRQAKQVNRSFSKSSDTNRTRPIPQLRASPAGSRQARRWLSSEETGTAPDSSSPPSDIEEHCLGFAVRAALQPDIEAPPVAALRSGEKGGAASGIFD